MIDGFIKVAAVTPCVNLANVKDNAKKHIEHIKKANGLGAKIIVFPELSLTGVSIKDALYQDLLLCEAKEELVNIAKETEKVDALIAIGLPFEFEGKLYNAVALLNHGEILAIIPKQNLSRKEEKYFSYGFGEIKACDICGIETIIGSNVIASTESLPSIRLCVCIGDDISLIGGNIVKAVASGANVILNPDSIIALVNSKKSNKTELEYISDKLNIGIIKSSSGEGESTTDVVYSGYDYIVESGRVLEESNGFVEDCIISEIDVDYLSMKSRTNDIDYVTNEEYVFLDFEIKKEETVLTRKVNKSEFVIDNEKLLQLRCEEILDIQCYGLKKRLEVTGSNHVVVGISGGLDSTLALIVCKRCFDIMGIDSKNIIAVTMPGFGTTDRTYDNAVSMMKEVGVTFKEVSIREAVKGHFVDIGHNLDDRNVTYENAQARERTQILMDIANDVNGMVIGTGDLSELALGWATYNGDHMSNYAVNAGIAKTLIQYIVKYYANNYSSDRLKAALFDVLDTPISPELLPAKDGEIEQKTEDIVGPYELHDFYLYYFMNYRCTPKKLFRLAKVAFCEEYNDEELLKWEKNFYKRFFAQQFKRSCMPDGPKVGCIDFSPRGDFDFISDASSMLWIDEIDNIKF